LTSEAFATLMKRLFNTNLVTQTPVTQGTFARLLQPMMAGSRVKLETGGALKETANPATRLEAAQIIAEFLEERALARMSGQEQTLLWPGWREPTPLRPEESALPGTAMLQAELRTLVEHKVIDSADYWISHLAKESACDGKRVAALLRKAANAIQPGTEEGQAIAVCVSAGFLRSPGYWQKNAVEGGQCSGPYVTSVIHRIAQHLALMKPAPL
jgi:hypothetical protein